MLTSLAWPTVMPGELDSMDESSSEAEDVETEMCAATIGVAPDAICVLIIAFWHSLVDFGNVPLPRSRPRFEGPFIVPYFVT